MVGKWASGQAFRQSVAPLPEGAGRLVSQSLLHKRLKWAATPHTPWSSPLSASDTSMTNQETAQWAVQHSQKGELQRYLVLAGEEQKGLAS